MEIRIKATKIELTDELRAYLEEKMNMLEKYLGDVPVINCDTELALAVGGQSSGKIYRAEVNLNLPGELLRITKTEEDIKKAIDKVKDHLVAMIIKYKEKRVGK